MKRMLVPFTMIMLLFTQLEAASASPCSILNEEKIQIGNSPAIRGTCSNNGLPISCLYLDGTGIECDGPGGGYTGYDLNNLIYSACGCSTEEEKELQMRKRLGEK